MDRLVDMSCLLAWYAAHDVFPVAFSYRLSWVCSSHPRSSSPCFLNPLLLLLKHVTLVGGNGVLQEQALPMLHALTGCDKVF